MQGGGARLQTAGPAALAAGGLAASSSEGDPDSCVCDLDWNEYEQWFASSNNGFNTLANQVIKKQHIHTHITYTTIQNSTSNIDMDKKHNSICISRQCIGSRCGRGVVASVTVADH